MRNKTILKGLTCLMAAGCFGLTSCSDSYLDLNPVSSTSTETVKGSVEYCSYTVNAIAATLYYTPTGYESNWPCGNQGEASIATRYGDSMGADAYYCTMADDQNGAVIRLNYLNNGRLSLNALPWGYYYGIIAQANAILDGIDDAHGSEELRKFTKAQLLTFRAHAYCRLLQFFAPRWIDSNEGEHIAVPLRLTASTEPMASSSMKAVLDQMYKDLDLAIQLYKEAPNQKRTNATCPDINLCYGIYARLALLKNDWKTAQEMAHNARQGYTLMSGEEYLQGFVEANHEWMWYGTTDQQNNQGYAFWGAYNSCNGAYPTLWADYPGAGSINIDLYNQMDENDIRRQCFLTPDKLSGVKLENWYNDKYVNEHTMNFYDMTKNRSMSRKAAEWSVARTPKNPSFGELTAAYMGDNGTENTRTPVFQYGAQVKFYSVIPYGWTQYPFMRAAEMWLIEAEAAAMRGDTQTAQSVITELGSKRVNGYTCSKTGQALIDEIRLQRRFELWGEGFNFFDLKRWNLPIERRAWKAGDTTSGNIPAFAAGTVLPTEGNHWIWCVPAAETDYNPLIHEEDYRWQ